MPANLRDQHAAEYRAAKHLAESTGRSGDLVGVFGQPGLAQTAYVPKSIRASQYANRMGDGIRIFRPEGMGDLDYEDFVNKFTNYMDHLMELSPAFRNEVIFISNGSPSIQMDKFYQGNRTFVAISPSLGTRARGGMSTVGGLANVAQRKSGPYNPDDRFKIFAEGSRPEIRIGSVGEGAPSSLWMRPDIIEGFTVAKEKGFDFGRLSHREIENYLRSLKFLGHEFSHVSAHFRGIAFNNELAVRRIFSNKRMSHSVYEGIIQLVEFYDEMETIGWAPGRRVITESIIVQDLIDRGLGIGEPRLTLPYTYGRITAYEMRNFLRTGPVVHLGIETEN